MRAAPTSATIASCDEFSIRRVILGPGEQLRFEAKQQPRILSVSAGGLTVASGTAPVRSLPLGQNVLVPWSSDATFTAPESSIVLVTEDFA